MAVLVVFFVVEGADASAVRRAALGGAVIARTIQGPRIMSAAAMTSVGGGSTIVTARFSPSRARETQRHRPK